MRAIVVMLFITAKLAALGLLPFLVLGYVFFLGSQSVLSHLYTAATSIGLILTIAATPRTFHSLRFVHGFAVLAAIALGGWKVQEHLAFFEGPEYGAAGMTGLAVLAIVVGFFGSRYLFGSTRGSADV